MEDEYSYQRLSAQEESFQAIDQYTYFEFWSFAGVHNAQLMSEQEIEDESRILQILENGTQGTTSAREDRSSTLKILIAKTPVELDPESRIPFSRHVFCTLTETWNLPRGFLRDVEMQSPPMLRKCAPMRNQDCSHQGYIFRTNNSNYLNCNFNLLVSHDASTDTTYALLHGPTKYEVSDLKRRILAAPAPLLSSPLFIPMMLLTTSIEAVPKHTHTYRNMIRKIQLTVGFEDSKTATRKLLNREVAQPYELHVKNGKAGYDLAIGMLTRLGTDLAYHGFHEAALLSYLETIQGLLTADEGETEVGKELLARAAYLKKFLDGDAMRVKYLTESSRTQVQTLYTLLAQEDSASNQKIARATQDDNRIMIALAEATQRDGAAMRTIAVMTFLFLPATCTATLFSASFFDFSQPSSSSVGGAPTAASAQNKVVSKWIWLYWLVTGSLTLIVFLAWLVIHVVMKRKFGRPFGEIEDEEERARGMSPGGGNVKGTLPSLSPQMSPSPIQFRVGSAGAASLGRNRRQSRTSQVVMQEREMASHAVSSPGEKWRAMHEDDLALKEYISQGETPP